MSIRISDFSNAKRFDYYEEKMKLEQVLKPLSLDEISFLADLVQRAPNDGTVSVEAQELLWKKLCFMQSTHSKPEAKPGCFDFEDGNGPVPAHKHPNGGGWVADTARVDSTVYVGPAAKVYGHAKVHGGARVEDYAKVFGNAQVHGCAQVHGNALVYGSAQVFEEACVYDDAQVFGHAKVYGNARVHDDSKVHGKARVYDNSEVFKSAEVCDLAEVCGYAHVYTVMSGDDIESGTT